MPTSRATQRRSSAVVNAVGIGPAWVHSVVRHSMTTFDLTDKEGRVFAFEIPNVGREAFCQIVQSFPGVRVVRSPKFLSEFREGEFCEFELAGQTFRACEPFGDNSRYWVGPEPVAWCEQVVIIRDLFRCYGETVRA